MVFAATNVEIFGNQFKIFKKVPGEYIFIRDLTVHTNGNISVLKYHIIYLFLLIGHNDLKGLYT